MKWLIEKKKARAAKVAQLRGMVDLAGNEARDLTEAEVSAYNAVEAEVRALDTEVERLERLAADEKRMAELEARHVAASQIPGPRSEKAEPLDDGEFRDFGEFMQTVVINPGDRRLTVVEMRDNKMGVGSQGGFLIPPMHAQPILAVNPPDALVRPRATVIPAGDVAPDAGHVVPVIDNTEDNIGGVTVRWTGEAKTKPESSGPSFLERSLLPKEVSGWIPVSDQLLANAPYLNGVLSGLLRMALAKGEDRSFISGNGVAKPLGFSGHSCAIYVNRALANKIAYADLAKMFARVYGDNLVWATTRSALPQLMSLKDDSGRLIWQPSAVVGQPDTLLGRPLMYHERLPLLGAKGDLMIADLSHYVIKDGYGPAVAVSQHVRFLENQTVIKIFRRVDGQPGLEKPIKQENNWTVSPFVFLDVPAA
jgi:HK97 family phage major capsid protein